MYCLFVLQIYEYNSYLPNRLNLLASYNTSSQRVIPQNGVLLRDDTSQPAIHQNQPKMRDATLKSRGKMPLNGRRVFCFSQNKRIFVVLWQRV